MTGRILAIAIALFPALAHAAPPGETPRVVRHKRPPAPTLTRLGVGTDVGVPDGATASIVVRPVRALRLHAGGGSNYVSPGIRAGVTLVPLASWFSPTLSVDIGRYFDGDANPLLRMVTGDHSLSIAALNRVGYDYANLHAGLEFGRKRLTFYLHAGASRIATEVHELGATTDAMSGVTFTSDPRVRAWTPSARLGLILYVK